jgi:hypothetical protein
MLAFVADAQASARRIAILDRDKCGLMIMDEAGHPSQALS